MIVGHFDHVFRLDRLPYGRSLCRPAAGTAWGISGKALSLPHGFELVGQGWLVLGFDTLPARLTVFTIATAADDTVRTSVALYLLHTFSIAGLTRKVEALGDDAIASSTA